MAIEDQLPNLWQIVFLYNQTKKQKTLPADIDFPTTQTQLIIRPY